MFERYDEPARRSLFFARYEASQLGSLTIESEHLLLGLMRQPTGVVEGLFEGMPLADIRKAVTASVQFQERVSTSVEIPFSAGVKRVLGYAAEEADALQHPHIGTEHLLLGVLREETSIAATVLHKYGLRLDNAREKAKRPSAPELPAIAADHQARAQVAQLLDLVNQLASSLEQNREAMVMLALIRMDVENLKKRIEAS